MKKIPFVKCTLNGNKFVIVDEIKKQILTESEKFDFAYVATDVYYGIGSDELLAIQPYTPEVLREINEVRGYWKKLPYPTAADFIFRILEPDGTEAFSCGNGLLCVSDHLYRKYGIKSARIMTEIPTSTPKVITIGRDPDKKLSWANMGYPRRISAEIVATPITKPYDDKTDMIENFPICIPQRSLLDSDANISDMDENFPICLPQRRFLDSDANISLRVSGYLIFTGEPHLVIFPDAGGFSSEKLAKYVFNPRQSIRWDKQTKILPNLNCRLTQLIGMTFNQNNAEYFPFGINVDLARILSTDGIIEYRCFEKGINRETWACGTGAVAVAYIANYLKMIDTQDVTMFPYISHSYDPNAQLNVRIIDNDYYLYGYPQLLFEGTFLRRD